jgi:hypothetical protein
MSSRRSRCATASNHAVTVYGEDEDEQGRRDLSPIPRREAPQFAEIPSQEKKPTGVGVH